VGWKPYGNEVDLIVGEVELLGAPSSGNQRMLVGLSIPNIDTASHPITILHKKGAVYTTLLGSDVFPGFALPDLGAVTLDAVDESIVAQMTGSIVTTAPRAAVSYTERTP
jgi:hypothetical protein